jgi:hypothetical protein
LRLQTVFFSLCGVRRQFQPSTYFKYAEGQNSLPRHSYSDGGLCGLLNTGILLKTDEKSRRLAGLNKKNPHFQTQTV